MRTVLWLLAPAALFSSGVAMATTTTGDLALVDAAIKSGRLVQAQTMLDLLPADQKEATDVAILRAQLLLAQGQYEGAEQAFDKLATAAGSDCRVITGLGIAAGELRHTDRAIPLLQDAAARCMPDWRLWSELGRAYSWTRRWDKIRGTGTSRDGACGTTGWCGRVGRIDSGSDIGRTARIDEHITRPEKWMIGSRRMHSRDVLQARLAVWVER